MWFIKVFTNHRTNSECVLPIQATMKGVSAIIGKLLEEGLGEDQIVERLKEYGYAESYIKRQLSKFRQRPSEKFLAYVVMQVRRLPDDLPKKELESFLRKTDNKGVRAVLGFVRIAQKYYRSKETIKRLTGIEL